MSAHPTAADTGTEHEHDKRHVHSHHHHGAHEDGEAHGSFGGYVKGFLLSVVLTAIPFWIVMGDVFKSKSTAIIVLLVFAFAQILVHMIYFLHMNTSSEGGWNMLALIFTAVLVVITLSGSLWVMYNMNANMMPSSAHEMRTAP